MYVHFIMDTHTPTHIQALCARVKQSESICSLGPESLVLTRKQLVGSLKLQVSFAKEPYERESSGP